MSGKSGPQLGNSGIITTGLLILTVAFLLTCARERPLQPSPAPEPLVHEPWEDREAEDLAWLISGEVCARKEMYERIISDLEAIRVQWGDSLLFCGPDCKWQIHIPVIKQTFAWPLADPGNIELLVEPEARAEMEKGAYHDWDSINSLFGAVLEVNHGIPYLISRARINPYRMMTSYEGLRGVRAVYFGNASVGDASNIYAFRHEWGNAYLFCYAWGDCPMGCLYRQYYYFRAKSTGIEYVGECLDPDRDVTPPAWWPEAKACRELWRRGDAEYRYRDVMPPARVSDLSVVTPQDGGKATIAFTSPGNDGFDGQAYSCIVRWDTLLITEANWNAMTGPSETRPITSFPATATGTVVTFDLSRLYAHSVNYIAVRTQDGRGNLAPMSNVVTSR